MAESEVPGNRRSYSTVFVAKQLGVSIPTVQRWVDAGLLRAWKTLGGHRRIDAESADEMILKHSGAAMDAATPLEEPVRIVVVDDNPDDRDLLSALVVAALPGAAVTVAENGFVGLMAIGQTNPRIVITDLQMPKMDGIEMLKQISNAEGVRPHALIAVSSMTPKQLAQRGELPESVEFVRKPIDDPTAFIAMLRNFAA